MKKVGILTLPLNDNYGGLLQAVALSGFLSLQGFEVVFLRNEYFKNKWKSLVWSAIARVPFQNVNGARYAHKKRLLHKAFIKDYIPRRTRTLRSIEDFKSVVKQEKLDAVIVGSDQVWRWDYILDGFERYFLSFVDGSKTRKVSYAASFGKPQWQAAEKMDQVSSLLADFHAVSARESDGVTICQELGRKDCQLVIDPTLLVNRHFYDQFLVKPKHTSQQKTLLTYVLDEQGKKKEFIDAVSANLGEDYVTKSLGLQSNMTAPEWVTAFHDADYVITDSFHGMAFSIMFNKPFIVIGNSHRGVSRFTSLLQQLDLLSRMVDETSLDNYSVKELVSHKVDYNEINTKLQLLREKSSNFLINALEVTP
ncbi:polysaccharide pyruvyl transferase family protein [Methylophilus sp.]|uniref:polysaccharide pyruvyl transferase family protein n=1 Tax=Methylophilus sp. TaxID=29541 RepID=UPI004035CE69